MILMIEPAWSLLLSGVTGLIVWMVWRFCLKRVEEYGNPRLCYKALLCAALLFIIPVAAIAANLLEACFYLWKGDMFWGSPTLHKASVFITRVWICGVLVFLIAFTLIASFSSLRLKKSFPCDKATIEVFTEQCRTAGVSAESVRLMQSYYIDTPIQAGFFRKAIVLPENSYSRQELEFIFAHELTHIKQRSNLAKLLACTALVLQWFNPAAWLLRREVFRRSEYACDDAASSIIGQKNYYLLLEQVAVKDKARLSPFWSSLGEKECDIVDRTRRASQHNKPASRTGKTISRTILAAVLGISLIVASTQAFAQIYITLTNMTEESTELPSYEFPAVQHEEGLPPGVFEIVDYDTAVQSKGTTEFDWTVASGIRKLSKSIYLEEGQAVILSGNISPNSVSVKVGIRDSSLNSSYVSVNGLFSCLFSITTSDYYRIFVENTSGTTVTANFTALIY